MNRVIRYNIFETNSSSTHSISISKTKKIVNDLTVDSDGTCRIEPGEFGWEEETFRDPYSKASYCLTHIKASQDEYHREPTLILKREEMLKDVIKEVTGATDVIFEKRGEKAFCPWGYIDHQSIEDGGGVGEEVFKSEETLKNFIFNPDSILRTDNDNH